MLINKFFALGLTIFYCDLAISADFLVSQGQSVNTGESNWCRQMTNHRRSVEQKRNECQRLQKNINSSDRAGGFTLSADLNCSGFDRELQQITVALTQNGC